MCHKRAQKTSQSMCRPTCPTEFFFEEDSRTDGFQNVYNVRAFFPNAQSTVKVYVVQTSCKKKLNKKILQLYYDTFLTK